MTGQIGIATAGNATTSLLEAQAARLLARSRAGAASDSVGDDSKGRQEAKILKSSRDFESILLGSWLQQAEQSFAKVPGGDGEDDEDAGKDQFQGIAMQALAGSLTAGGGIGIAKMIAGHLRGSVDKGTRQPAGTTEGEGGGGASRL